MKIPETCNTLEELSECGQFACLRLMLARSHIISITAEEDKELFFFAKRWSKRYDELTEGEQ